MMWWRVRVEVLALSPDGKQEPREVEQFRGEGRVAARGFRHPHFVPGQLFLMDDDVVGFLWLPIGTFVVFSRVPEDEEPTANSKSVTTAVREMIDGVQMEEGDEGEDDLEGPSAGSHGVWSD